MTDLDRLIKLVSENPNYQSTKISNEIQSLKSQIEADLELLNQVTKILSNYCGETGQNEGLIKTLERKLKHG